MTFTTNGGRLGNQLYYILHAYITGNTYCIRKDNADRDLIIDILNKIGLQKYFCTTDTNAEFINDYFQYFTKDFTEKDISQFITQCILPSKCFTNISTGLNDKDLLIYIRCGDYLKLPLHNCFDRNDYLYKSLQESGFRKNIVVQSEDIEYCKNNYSNLLNKFCDNIMWHTPGNVLDDFVYLCSFKNKIIWNSTFSIWSSFISNVIFQDSYKNIICPNVQYMLSDFNSLSPLYNPKWNIIKCIKK